MIKALKVVMPVEKQQGEHPSVGLPKSIYSKEGITVFMKVAHIKELEEGIFSLSPPVCL